MAKTAYPERVTGKRHFELDEQILQLGGPDEGTFTRTELLAFRDAPARTPAPPAMPAHHNQKPDSGWVCDRPSRNRYHSSSSPCRCDGCRQANRDYQRRRRP